jgi:hypothetical protein
MDHYPITDKDAAFYERMVAYNAGVTQYRSLADPYISRNVQTIANFLRFDDCGFLLGAGHWWSSI